MHAGGVIDSVMPKGVEHCWHRASLDWGEFVIDSVMPKGVEHPGPVSDSYDPEW